ncbi:MAG: hypothetical protein AAF600_10850 [Bacteroidota bacterium]
MINDRIHRLIQVLNMNPTSFSDSLNVSVTVIFNIIKGRRSKPSYDLIRKMLKTYNKLNTEWLIKGEGSMWNDDIVTSERFAPSNLQVELRVKELLFKLSQKNPDSHEYIELEELVSYIITESLEQKHKLVVLHERQEGMIKLLKEKLKLRS